MTASALWADLVATLRAAQVERDVMRHREKPQIDRDLAAVAYGRHCDRIMDVLDQMAERQLLTQIGLLLPIARVR